VHRRELLFGVHSVLWLVRSLVDVLRHGRPRGLVPGGAAYVRFQSFHRWFHTILLISFLALAITGLPLKYSQYEWAKALAWLLGGFESTSVWHRLFGLVTFVCLAAYLVRMVSRYRSSRAAGARRTSAILGPDSPVPNFRDVKDFARMALWFVGLGKKPTFERWAYWEKFDFWGACADTVIIGTTGLILWFPNFFCSFLPGNALNIAKVIHSTLALLATGFVFAIHFFSTHFRADKFPVDMSILAGLVSEEEMKHERPELLERLAREGRLDQLRVTVPSRKRLWMLRLAGLAALAVGLTMLAAMTYAGLQ
jgi:cytochrome b subunit of formate dehydrogenase